MNSNRRINCCFVFSLTVFVSALLFVNEKQAEAQTMKSYEASLNTLPTAQGWSLYNSDSSTPNTSNGTLFQGPTSYGGYQYWSSPNASSSFSSSNRFVLEAQLKVVQSNYVTNAFGDSNAWRTGYVILASDANSHGYLLGISDTGIRFGDAVGWNNLNGSPFIPLDTTSQFNTYRLEVANGLGSLFVNGNLITSLNLDNVQYDSANDVIFGDGTALAGSQTQLHYVRYSSVAAVPEPGAVALLTGAAFCAGGVFLRRHRKQAQTPTE